MNDGERSPLSPQEQLNSPPGQSPVEGRGKLQQKERKTRVEAQLDQVQAAISHEIDRSTTKEAFKKARKQGFPVVQRILAARDKAAKIQESLLEEAIYTSIGLISRVKQKALTGVLEWLEDFVEDKEKLKELSPSQAKTLLSIAYTADQMGRLELGKSTSNVAIAHQSSTPQQTSLLQQAVDKLKEVDPVFDYSNVNIKAVELLPDGADKERVLSSGEGSGRAVDPVGLQHDDSGARDDDGGSLSSDQ